MELETRDGHLVRESGVIAKEITRFYKDLYFKKNLSRPFLEGLHWCTIAYKKVFS